MPNMPPGERIRYLRTEHYRIEHPVACCRKDYQNWPCDVISALNAATAYERAQIRQLATEHGAEYRTPPCTNPGCPEVVGEHVHKLPFADLIGGGGKRTAAARFTLVWRDERGTEICQSTPLAPGTLKIGIPLDAQSADLIGGADG